MNLPFRMRTETPWEIMRATSFWTKEPETIKWIESFKKGEKFLDIGANVGIYSLYAAKMGAKVLAIEPHMGNFTALTINTRGLNRGLGIQCIWACVGHKNSMVEFSYEEMTAGTTGGSYSRENRHKINVKCYTVDELSKYWGPFDHIKIDVDGEEKLIVQGMWDTLENRRIKSCLIESEPQHKSWIITQMEANGYTRANEWNLMVPHSRERRKQEGINVENIVFCRVDGWERRT